MSNALPQDLLYSKEHEWIRKGQDGRARIGITQHAVDQLGDITLVTLPPVGDEITAGESFGDIDSVKAVSELYAPATGKVSAVNEALEDTPELVNESPYDSGWMIEIELDADSTSELMDADAYAQFTAEAE